jgi:hypothetical protein
VEFTPEQAMAAVLESLGVEAGAFDEDALVAMARVFASNTQMMTRYEPEVFTGDLIHVRATIGKTADAPSPDDWNSYVDGSVVRHDVEATHGGLLAPTPLGEIGPVLAASLEEK